jgi:hypothetical protein
MYNNNFNNICYKKQAMLPTALATPLMKTVIKASALIQTAEVL